MEKPSMNEAPRPTHPVTEWIKAKITFFKNLTKTRVEDSLWLTGIKYFFQGLMILLLILMSPFALVAIILSALMAG